MGTLEYYLAALLVIATIILVVGGAYIFLMALARVFFASLQGILFGAERKREFEREWKKENPGYGIRYAAIGIALIGIGLVFGFIAEVLISN